MPDYVIGVIYLKSVAGDFSPARTQTSDIWLEMAALFYLLRGNSTMLPLRPSRLGIHITARTTHGFRTIVGISSVHTSNNGIRLFFIHKAYFRLLILREHQRQAFLSCRFDRRRDYNAGVIKAVRMRPVKMQFPNPFPGKPSPLSISGLFLFDPSVHTKLAGMPFRSTLEGRFGSALSKRIDRAMKTQTVSPKLVDKLLSAISSNDNPFVELMRAACAGETDAAAAMDVIGAWESFFAGFEGPLDYRQLYRIAIERASKEPTEALRRGDFSAAVAQLLAAPISNALLWQEAVEALDGATAIEHLQAVQFAVAMEVELSCLAALEAQFQMETGNMKSKLTTLLSEEEPTLNPAAVFFRWIVRTVGAESMGELEKELQRLGCPIHLTTLKNWNRGVRLPSMTWLKLIAKLKPELASCDEIWILYWASKILTLLGYYGTLCAERSRFFEGNPAARTHLRPWPMFPHGCANFGGWLRARFPTWVAYHCARIKTMPI